MEETVYKRLAGTGPGVFTRKQKPSGLFPGCTLESPRELLTNTDIHAFPLRVRSRWE